MHSVLKIYVYCNDYMGYVSENNWKKKLKQIKKNDK